MDSKIDKADKLENPKITIIKSVLIVASSIMLFVLIYMIYADSKASESIKAVESFKVNETRSTSEINNLNEAEGEVKGEVVEEIVVEISGEINKPAIYKVKLGFRLGELVELAGGLTEKADSKYISQNINFASKLEDEQKIYIPSVDDTKALVSEPISNPSIQVNPLTPKPNSNTSTPKVTGLININMATVGELDSLPGIGPATAEKIINARPFNSIEELKNVSGIGDAKYSEIKDKVTI